jgi:hypothetical protein
MRAQMLDAIADEKRLLYPILASMAAAGGVTSALVDS